MTKKKTTKAKRMGRPPKPKEERINALTFSVRFAMEDAKAFLKRWHKHNARKGVKKLSRCEYAREVLALRIK